MKKYLLAAALLFSSLCIAQSHPFSQRPGDNRTPEKFLADCKAGIALPSCYAQPVAPDCLPGKHWSLEGSGYAHCVLDELTCPSGTELSHDRLGNPECQPIVCPRGSELVDGKCITAPTPPAPPINTWTGQVAASALCGRIPGNGRATGCNTNLGAVVTTWLRNNVSLAASQNPEVQATIQFFYSNCPTLLLSHHDEKVVNYTSSSGAIIGTCRTMYDPELMPSRPNQVKYDSISNWYLNLTNIPR